jgi:bifunctional non-homologous end joining protein LigD
MPYIATALQKYHKKRNFEEQELQGSTEQKSKKDSELSFVVQKHDTTRLHYVFRLETKKGAGDVLKSWAVPKGVSPDPKRLAVLTEDHPSYCLLFEGIIPEGVYGAGTGIVWETGSYTNESDLSEQFNKGKPVILLKTSMYNMTNHRRTIKREMMVCLKYFIYHALNISREIIL